MSFIRPLFSTAVNRTLLARSFSAGGWSNLGSRNAEESNEYENANEDASSQPRYRSNRPYRDYNTPQSSAATYSATAQQAKDTVHPFPEELQQDYSLPPLNDSTAAFSEDIIKNLNEPVPVEDVEIKPDGSLYLPEVRYRRILLRAFGPAGWCLVPRGAHSLTQGVLSREYALLCHGRFVAQARGSAQIAQTLANPALASESVRSNALMRCCKDLGVASDLWDHSWVNQWKNAYAMKKQITDGQGRTRFTWLKKEI